MIEKETNDIVTGAFKLGAQKIQEQREAIKEKDHRIAVLEKALRTAVIEYDFAKYKEQSTTSENIKRILKLEKYVINQAEKELEEESK